MESLQIQSTSSSAPATIPLPMLSPSSTIVRVKRKRSAGPLSGLVVSSKKAKATSPSEESSSQEQPDERVDEQPTEPSKNAEDVIFLSHVGTSDLPSLRYANSTAPFLKREHKVVEMIDYNPESGSLGKRKLSVLDHGYLEVMRAAKAISDFGLDERERKEFESASTAPLAKGELELLDEFDDEEDPGTSESGKKRAEEEYVYDFYCTPHNQISLFPDKYGTHGENDGFQVRLPTDEELQLYFGGDDDDGSEGLLDDDDDSNAEDNYKNDYPEEVENDTTSDEDGDEYDHYGDENDEYENNLAWRGDQGADSDDDD